MKKLISILFTILLIGCGSDSDSNYTEQDPITNVPQSTIGYPKISVSSKCIIFYTTGLNRRSYYEITVYNDGNSSLIFEGEPYTDNSVFVFDPDASDINSLDSGSSTKILLYFAPTDWDTEYTGTLYIESNDPDNPVLSISLAGKSQDIIPSAEITIGGIKPDDYDTISIEFPEQERCGESEPKELIIKNNGSVDGLFFRIEEPSNCQYSVYWDGFEVDNSWFIGSDEFNISLGTLDVGQSATLGLVFHPDSNYDWGSWVWTIYTNDPKRPIIFVDVIAEATGMGTCECPQN